MRTWENNSIYPWPVQLLLLRNFIVVKSDPCQFLEEMMWDLDKLRQSRLLSCHCLVPVQPKAARWRDLQQTVVCRPAHSSKELFQQRAFRCAAPPYLIPKPTDAALILLNNKQSRENNRNEEMNKADCLEGALPLLVWMIQKLPLIQTFSSQQSLSDKITSCYETLGSRTFR